MNWKTLCVVAGLIVATSLTACSNSPTDTENQADPAVSPATENVVPGTGTDNSDATKSDGAKTDTTKSNDAKIDTTKSDGATTDTTKTDATKIDATKSDGAKTDATKTDATKTEDSTANP